MKLIILADLHIHNYKQFNNNGDRLLNCISVLEQTFNYAHLNNIDTILFAGDLFDQQKALSTSVINATIKVFKDLFELHPTISFVAISGNHDHASKNFFESQAESALKFLSDIFNQFILIDNEVWYLDKKFGDHVCVSGIPYYSFIEDFQLALDDVFAVDGYHNILLTHQTPQGIDNQFIPADLNTEFSKNWDFVFNGHIHKHQLINKNFMSVGSPLQRDAGDIGQDKGFIVYDTETSNWKRIILNFPVFEYVDELSDSKEGVYQIVKPPQFEVKQGDVDRYSTDINTKELVTNFFNDATNGLDKELLDAGLKCCENE